MTLLLLLALMVPMPDGFRESVRLAPIASQISGKPVYVRCARTETAWAAMLRPWDIPVNADGLTFPDNEGSYLAPRTCRDLEGWLRGKNAPTPARLGVVVVALVHEAVHTRGVDDESEADCAALRELPTFLRRWFGVKRPATLRKVMAAAWANHRTKPPAYRTSC